MLTVLVMYGSNTSMNSRTRNVGIESSDDDFTGDDITILRTSDSVHGLNDDSEDDCRTSVRLDSVRLSHQLVCSRTVPTTSAFQ